MECDPDDLRMSFRTEGVHVEIYDTYCKNITQQDREAFDSKINDILYRAELRRQMAKFRGAGVASPPETAPCSGDTCSMTGGCKSEGGSYGEEEGQRLRHRDTLP